MRHFRWRLFAPPPDSPQTLQLPASIFEGAYEETVTFFDLYGIVLVVRNSICAIWNLPRNDSRTTHESERIRAVLFKQSVEYGHLRRSGGLQFRELH